MTFGEILTARVRLVLNGRKTDNRDKEFFGRRDRTSEELREHNVSMRAELDRFTEMGNIYKLNPTNFPILCANIPHTSLYDNRMDGVPQGASVKKRQVTVALDEESWALIDHESGGRIVDTDWIVTKMLVDAMGDFRRKYPNLVTARLREIRLMETEETDR